MSEEGWKKRGQGQREGIPPLGSKPVKEGPFKDPMVYEQFNPRNPKLK